ncbi:MAG: DUF488 domain-containing protein [Isosphaeraceae bacterium]|nr:DUF488 domain-containing protein [Isosphaeraceae bacterium]
MPNRPGIATPTLWTVGYGAWPTPVRAERLVASLVARGVTRLVDVRLNPCSSDVNEGRYGPKPWTLQTGQAGIVGILNAAGIAYEWLVELGNPQRHDKAMTVLRAHLADHAADWPVHRGLDRLEALVGSQRAVVSLLCACADVRVCHRWLIARALAARRNASGLVIRDVRTGQEIPPPQGAVL